MQTSRTERPTETKRLALANSDQAIAKQAGRTEAAANTSSTAAAANSTAAAAAAAADDSLPSQGGPIAAKSSGGRYPPVPSPTPMVAQGSILEVEGWLDERKPAAKTSNDEDEDCCDINPSTGRPYLPLPPLAAPTSGVTAAEAHAAVNEPSAPIRTNDTRHRLASSRKRKFVQQPINKIDTTKPFPGENDDATYDTNHQTIDTNHQVPVAGMRLRIHAGSSVASERRDALAHLPPVPPADESIDTARDVAIGLANDNMSVSRMDAVLDDLDKHERDDKPLISIVGTEDGQHLIDCPNLTKGDKGWGDDNWLDYYHCLSSFKAANGHMKVPKGYLVTIGMSQEERNLNTWCKKQRRTTCITQGRIEKLDEIGFPWAPQEELWEDMFALLLEYRNENHGSVNIPRKHTVNGKKLGSWVSTQRQLYKSNRLALARAKRLEDVGFVWTILEAWEDMFALLLEYRNENHGSVNVPRKHTVNGKKLGRWVNTQRQLYKSNRLALARAKRLEDVGFVWTILEAWEDMFALLLEYRNENHGSVNVPIKHTVNGKKLGSWVSTQRQLYKSNRLALARAKRLEDVGFVWTVLEAWEDMFALLLEYRNENHGSVNVPIKHTVNGKKLGSWVNTQRRFYRSNQLALAKVKRLEDVGFMWNAHRGRYHR